MEKGEGFELKLRKTVTIAVDVSVGATIVVIGLIILPFPLNLVWGLFNVWLWVVAPSMLLWAKRREEEKQALGEIYAVSQKPLQQEA